MHKVYEIKSLTRISHQLVLNNSIRLLIHVDCLIFEWVLASD